MSATTTTPGDLAAFLTARLGEDEAAARLAARKGGTWKQDDPVRYPGSISNLAAPVVYDEGAPDEYQAAHIARHDPARALREVQAKRAILAEHRSVNGVCIRCSALHAPVVWPCATVRALLAVYSDHPDYHETWKP